MAVSLPYIGDAAHQTGAEVSGVIRPRTIRCVYLLALLCAVPVLDVSLGQFSVSWLPGIVLLLDTLVRPTEAWIHRYWSWAMLLLAFWLGQTLSVAANVLGIVVIADGVRALDVNFSLVLPLIQFAYWATICLASAYVITEARLIEPLCRFLGWCMVCLALIRWSEVLFLNNIGAWKGNFFTTQNAYGFLFSCFGIYPLYRVFEQKGAARRIFLAGTLLVLSAAAINGSRSSWITLVLGYTLFTVASVIIQKQKWFRLVWVGLCVTFAVGIFPFLPDTLREPLVSRFDTFGKLDEDKSTEIRKLMAQKAWRLFEESPYVGVGSGQFRTSSTQLDIPSILRYSGQNYFDKKSPHNSYLPVLAESGIFGFAPLAILILLILVRGRKAFVALAPSLSLAPLAMYCGFIMFSLHMVSIAALTGATVWFLYACLIALLCLHKQQSEENRLETAP